MSITRKVVIIVISVFLLSALVNLVVQQLSIMPSFIALEKETAIKNADRALGAIDHELNQLTPSVSDWAYWTDTYTYVKGENPDYEKANLDIATTLDAMGINFLGIYDLTGKALWNQGLNLSTGEPLDLGQLTGSSLPENHPLLQHLQLDSEVKGIIRTPGAPLLVVAKPILTTDRQGPIAGTFIMGRFLDTDAVSRIAELTKIPILVMPTDRQAAVSGGKGAIGQGIRHTDITLAETPETWHALMTIFDIFGTPVLTLQIDTSRSISAQGAKAVKQSMAILAATGVLIMFILWKLLQYNMLQPITKLTEHAHRIGNNDDLRIRLKLNREDEIGVLARTFDQMLDNLSETRRRLIAQSYHSGIAETAMGVLHNIGNAITPLNIRLATLQQDLKTAPVAEMELVQAELADPATADDRRADLLSFMELAGVEMAHLVQKGREEIEVSIQQIRHIEGFLADQLRFSRAERVIEPVDMAAVIKEVEVELRQELQDTLHIEVTPSVAESGAVAGSHAALQQVVANLLINAAESVRSAGKAPGCLTITAEQENIQGQKMVGLRFTDNGAGIDHEHQNRLFERGFSTKNREGSGYGLHWSANTLQALGGRISIENVKVGCGACVHMLLPLA